MTKELRMLGILYDNLKISLYLLGRIQDLNVNYVLAYYTTETGTLPQAVCVFVKIRKHRKNSVHPSGLFKL